jgi:hypothetical protein
LSSRHAHSLQGLSSSQPPRRALQLCIDVLAVHMHALMLVTYGPSSLCDMWRDSFVSTYGPSTNIIACLLVRAVREHEPVGASVGALVFFAIHGIRAGQATPK